MIYVLQIQMNTILSLQFQIRREYNVTAKYSNVTDSETYKITMAWDRLQTQVGDGVGKT